MKKASEYRAHARECLSLSKGAELDAQRSTLLQMAADWANPAATRRSAELFAEEVMPHVK